MIYIYAPSPSAGARDLIHLIQEMGTPGRRMRTPRGLTRVAARATRGDLFIGWGHGLPAHPTLRERGVRFLNGLVLGNKYAEHLALLEGGVPVPALSRTPREGFIGRSNRHQGGRDLLYGGGRDYWVERLQVKREFRIHVMEGVSIRAGMKVPREGVPQHEWVRSWDGGWKISYSGEHRPHIRQATRDIAKRAVHVLNLNFGAVDVGECTDGRMVVFEVNKAPGIEGTSLFTYATKFVQMHNEGR